MDREYNVRYAADIKKAFPNLVVCTVWSAGVRGWYGWGAVGSDQRAADTGASQLQAQAGRSEQRAAICQGLGGDSRCAGAVLAEWVEFPVDTVLLSGDVSGVGRELSSISGAQAVLT